MNYRCPICIEDLAGRKLSRAIVARWEIDCRYCGGRIRLNVHPLELRIAIFSFAAFMVFAVLAWRLESRALTLAALCVGMAGILSLPVLERTALRTWARYVPITRNLDR